MRRCKGGNRMTPIHWQDIADEITRETEKSMRKDEPHAKEDVIVSAVKKHKLMYVELDPDESMFGLVGKAGSQWALLIGVSNRVLVYVIGSSDGKNWTPEALQLIYWEAINKNTAGKDPE